MKIKANIRQCCICGDEYSVLKHEDKPNQRYVCAKCGSVEETEDES